ncbi:hypothetical protein DFH11DRAFT_1070763 [Phellopilus nigrolimitatus]|nr:hypothetical protein DFH11DRAFT_1070763 [Phellopilus nigrolimitatus]
MTFNTMNTTFGAAFVGLVVSAVLYGLTLLQTYTYYRTYPNDSARLKSLVFILWFLDSLHLVLCTNAIYWYLVTNFNNPENLELTYWSMNIQTDCNGLIGLMVELFFAQRVWRVSKNWFLTGFITILAFVHCGLGIFFTVEGFILKEFSKYSQLTWVTSTGLGSAAAADITIAVSLVYFLSKNRTGFERTDSLITTLTVYAINTGLLTSICATAAVVSFATMPLNFVWLSFFWCLGKLYVNSLLASLNSREALRGRVIQKEGTFVNLSNLRTDAPLGSPISNRRFSQTNYMPQQLRITVETTKEQTSDYYSSSDLAVDGVPSPFLDASDTSISNHPTPSSAYFSGTQLSVFEARVDGLAFSERNSVNYRSSGSIEEHAQACLCSSRLVRATQYSVLF